MDKESTNSTIQVNKANTWGRSEFQIFSVIKFFLST